MGLTEVLLAAAAGARANAYAPYSGFSVGAAVEDGSGGVHSGCNLENASFGLTCCAERNAIAAAVAAGMKRGELKSVLLLTGGESPAVPCGACLQVIAEFAAPEIAIDCVTERGKSVRYALTDLLPSQFQFKP